MSTQGKPTTTAPAPQADKLPAESAQTNKDRIQEAVLKVARKSLMVSEELRRSLSQCEVVDLRLVVRGLLVFVLDRATYNVRGFMLLCGSGVGHVPKATAETLGREWRQINDSGTLRL